MKWPLVKHPDMHVGNLDSQIVVVTLWTPAREVVKHLDMQKIALAAPLYSRRRGLAPLLRSLLANPNIRHVIVTGADLDNVKDGLEAFFEKGAAERKVPGTDIELDNKLPQEAIDLVQKNITFHDCTEWKGKNWNNISSYIDKLEKQKPYAKAKRYPEPVFEKPIVLPSSPSGYHIEADNIVDAQAQLLSLILRFGESKIHLNTEPTRDLSLVTVSVKDASYQAPLPFTKKEGVNYQEQILRKAKGKEPYSYGNRMQKHFACDQVQTALDNLKKNPYSARGILLTYDPCKDSIGEISPGAIYVHVAIVHHAVCVTIHLRSMEAWQGTAQTFFGFNALSDFFVEKTGFPKGNIQLVLDRCYLMQRDTRKAKNFVDKNLHEAMRPKHDDPRGNLIITLKNKSIHVEHVGQDDKHLGSWTAKNAKKIYQKLAEHNVLHDDYHKYDIGAELQKAEFALKNNTEYHQDRKLR